MSPLEPRVRRPKRDREADDTDVTPTTAESVMIPSLHGDVLVHTLGYLDLPDVPSVTCVSKEFQQCLSKDEVWLPIALKREPTAVQLAQLLAPDPEQGPFVYKKHLKRRMERKRQDSTTERRGAILGTPRPLSAYVAEVDFVAYFNGEQTKRVSVVAEDLDFCGSDLGMYIEENGTDREEIAAFWKEENDDFEVIIHLIDRSSGKQLKLFHCLFGESSNGVDIEVAERCFSDLHVHSALSCLRRRCLCGYNELFACRLKLDCACACEDCEQGGFCERNGCCPPSPMSIGLQFVYDHYCQYNQVDYVSYTEDEILWFLAHGALFT